MGWWLLNYCEHFKKPFLEVVLSVLKSEQREVTFGQIMGLCCCGLASTRCDFVLK